MITRNKHTEIKELLETFPAVALLGPRQVGKTTLALDIAKNYESVYLDLETARDRAKLADPDYYFAQYKGKLVILDEIQQMPELFKELRGIIDTNIREGYGPGQFLLLGSASIDLLRQSGETLAGRIAYSELSVITAAEYIDDTEKLWVRGGFPSSILASSESKSLIWRLNFIKTYLERDIPMLGPRIPAETLRRFWTMLAHLQGATLNAANIAASLGVDGKTVMSYLDLLVDLLLVRRLEPLHTNIGKRLTKSPKIYVRDSGLVHALLGITDKETLLGNPIVGASWEGFVIENILNVLNPHLERAYFYRTSSGNELDLIIEKPTEIWAIEVKRTMAPVFSKGNRQASTDIGAVKNFIIYPGNERYPLGENIEAIGLVGFLAELAKR